MRKRSAHALPGLAAVLVMAIGVSSASANRLSLSHFLTRWAWSQIEFRSGLGAARCPITLEQSFHSATITKTIGALIGHVTSATIGTCAAGGFTILRETLPWHIQYGGFTGTLPRFTALKIDLIGVAFRVEMGFGLPCLARSTQAAPIVDIVEGIEWERGGNGIVRALRPDSAAQIPCGEFRAAFEGTATVTDNTGAADVLVRLI